MNFWAAVVVASVTLTVAACSSEDDDPKLLDGGTARGPGFSFRLGSGWRATDPEGSLASNREDREPLRRELRGSVQGGAWELPSDDPDERVAVFVVIGQTKEKRPWESAGAEAEAAGARDYRIDRRGISLDGADAAFTSSRAGPDGEIHTRSIRTTRGTLSYTIHVQMAIADTRLEQVREQVAASWRWQPLSAADRERLRKSRELEGSGYRVTLPEGWRGAPGDVLPEAKDLDADTVWTGYEDRDGLTNVIVSYTQAPYDDLARSLPLVQEDERRVFEPVDSFGRAPDLVVGGEPAASFDIATHVDGEPWRHLDVLTVHDGKLYGITLGSKRSRFAEDRRDFLDALSTWQWK